MRHPIIDTTRTVTVESEIVEIDGIDREIWAVVVRCPVNGLYVEGDYFASREEAVADLDARFAA
jgi:hypothetical protein